MAESRVVMLPTSSPSESSTMRAAPSAEPRTWATAAASASKARVPSASFGGLASTASTALRSVVSGSATVGLTLKKTTESGCPGFCAANARAACIAPSIEFFMLFEASIRSTVPIPCEDADVSTARFFTGLPFSVTFTSSVESGGLRGAGSVRMYERSGNSAVPASTTWMPSSAAAAGNATSATRTAARAGTAKRATRLTVGGPRRSWERAAARTGPPEGRSPASRTCRGRPGGDPSAGACR